MPSNEIHTPTTLEEDMKLSYSKSKEIMNTIRTLEKEPEATADKFHAEAVALASDGRLSSTEKQRIATKKSNFKQAERRLKTARRRWMHFTLNEEDGLYMSMHEAVADLRAAEEYVERYESMMADFPSRKRGGLVFDCIEWLERLGGYGLDIQVQTETQSGVMPLGSCM
jgi:hypothetical protein